ncbi:DedA family protein [Planosporangium sp. 12N6]|uniref:DedA family protein n=1 Tax=Planosporangium spinosum TaxID=3402278 RepID=UPI003CF0FC8A
MDDWLGQLQGLPTGLLDVALGVVMVLDAIPLVGVAVPGDVAVLTVVGLGSPLAGVFGLVWVVAGCLVGWSLTYVAGRLFADRIRRGRLGAWIGEARWVAAERALDGGGRVLVVAPFLPVLNTLVPLAAGGLRMPYGRFLRYSAVGSALWAGLYVLLGLVSRQLGGLLHGSSMMLAASVVVGLTVGWVTMLTVRRRFAVPDPLVAAPPAALASPPARLPARPVRPASPPGRGREPLSVVPATLGCERVAARR